VVFVTTLKHKALVLNVVQTNAALRVPFALNVHPHLLGDLFPADYAECRTFLKIVEFNPGLCKNPDFWAKENITKL